MKYKKPICECGKELTITAVFSCDILWTINSNGKRSKKHTFSADTQSGEHLECECGADYEIDFDEKGRILRGKEYSPV